MAARLALAVALRSAVQKRPIRRLNPFCRPNARTRARAQEARERGRARHERVSIVATPTDKGLDLSPSHDDNAAWEDTLLDAFGTTSPDFVSAEASRLAASLIDRGQTTVSTQVMKASLAAIDGTRPENEMAAMLAAQFVATHSLAMDLLGRTRRAETVDCLSAYGGLATKLLRASIGLTDAMAKLQRGGEQTVRVEHVHVHSGGQAIVGPVSHQGPGASLKTQDQSDGKLFTHAPCTPLLGPIEAEWSPVPLASSAGA